MNRARTAYAVVATVMYECSDVVRVYEDKGEAERFAQKCRDHEEKRPRAPDMEAPQSDWDAYLKRSERWEKTHPARPHTNRDYSVFPIPFYRRASKRKEEQSE